VMTPEEDDREMRIDEGFRDAYRKLETKMKDLAKDDRSVYLPNPEPLGPVDYVFICMEPSRGRWARSEAEARRKVEAGFRNFIASIETVVLHFCIQEYLCAPTQRYHITDLSKGAMLVKHADVTRTERYDRWYPLLLEELDLVAAPGARVFAVGVAVAQYLARRKFPRPFTRVIHYSSLAGSARAAGIIGREERFKAFRDSVSLERLRETADAVLRVSAIPATFRDETLAQLPKSQLSESLQRLIFNYKLAFETVRADNVASVNAS
jgi:hypothetical protein